MEPEKKSNGAFIGLAIIVIILIIGGIYAWQSNKNTLENSKTLPGVTTEDSDALNALELELNTTDTNAGVDVNTVQ